MKTRIALSMGDYNGIGPELILSILNDTKLKDSIQLQVYGPATVFEYYARLIGIPVSATVTDTSPSGNLDKHFIVDTSFDEIVPTPGRVSAMAGKWSILSFEAAIEAVQNGFSDAVVTAPISKEAIGLAGHNVPGHTEYIARKTGTTDFTMMLVTDSIRVALATAHVSIRQIPDLISTELIVKHLRNVNRTLKTQFGIPNPKIAVFGLNPHAGDGGVLGSEEYEVIMPAIMEARAEGIICDGPFPADGWFGNQRYLYFDAVLAMYHDQGLAPFKAISFGKGINFTAGLPIIRTSPDHGTAFDIAGQGQADPASFREAIHMAVRLSKLRKET